jgi:cytochrome P450
MKHDPRIRDFEDPEFDPFVAGSLVHGNTHDPYTPLAVLRRRAPVQEGCYGEAVGDPTYPSFAERGQREFLILGYQQVAAAAVNPENFPNGPALARNLGVVFGNTISIMDPPLHGRYRRIFQAAFLPRTIAGWGEDIVTPVVNRLMDRIAANGRADLVDDFTRHYPFQVIYRQLALPEDQAQIFHRLSIAQSLFGGAGHLRLRALEATAKLGEYFLAMAAKRRERPGNDLMSRLVQAEVDGEKLPDELIVSFLRQLINAGGETTFHATSSLLAALLLHPSQWAAVQNDRSLLPQAIEELLRWEPPSAVQMRYVAHDMMLGGVHMPAGSMADLCLGAANRDESIFPDPDRFDIFRPKIRHFGFGFGPHLCIGQHLARIEIKGALNAILDRLPNLRLDPNEPQPVIQGTNLRHPQHIHVLFD